MHHETSNIVSHKPGMMIHLYHPSMVYTHNPSTQRAKAGKWKFKDILSCLWNWKPAWTTWNPVDEVSVFIVEGSWFVFRALLSSYSSQLALKIRKAASARCFLLPFNIAPDFFMKAKLDHIFSFWVIQSLTRRTWENTNWHYRSD